MSWLQKLESALAKEADKIPAGWFCIDGEAKKLKLPKRTFSKKVEQAMKIGVLTRKKFRVFLNGKFRQVYYYSEAK